MATVKQNYILLTSLIINTTSIMISIDPVYIFELATT